MTQDPTRADFEETTETKMRDDFEEYIGQVALLEHAGKNGYKLLSTNVEWVAFRAGWKAATKHQSDKCAGLEVVVKDVIDYCRPQNQQRDFLAVVNTLHKALKEHRDSLEGG